MTLLATYSPSFTPGELAAFLGILAFLVGLALGLKKLFGHEPALHKEYVTRADHDRDFKILHTDLTQGAASRKKMHVEIDAIAREQAALRKVNEGQTTELGHVRSELRGVNARIDEIPKRTIELLATTKKLHE